MKKVLTGIKPSGSITLGNYIGAIKQMLEYQEKFENYIFIADMHSITVWQNPETLKKNIKELLEIYLACGLNPKKNKIFLQSENEFHTNISWLLECNTYYGELSRMIQFKEKSKQNANFTAGLLTYPILMAADILAYDVDYVPVGIDQKQHVELTRDIAERFNKKFGETFKIPEVLIKTEGTKIMDLIDPTKKMSKSDENDKGVILLLDDLAIIRKKIMGATTDSEMKVCFDPDNKPGISNLLNIYVSLTNKKMEEAEKEFENSNYGEFKKAVADIVIDVIKEIQEKYNEIKRSSLLNEVLDEGITQTKNIAKTKFELMKEKMGLTR